MKYPFKMAENGEDLTSEQTEKLLQFQVIDHAFSIILSWFAVTMFLV